MTVAGGITVKDGVLNMGVLGWTGSMLNVGKAMIDNGATQINFVSATIGSGVTYSGEKPLTFSVGTYSGVINGSGIIIVRRNLDNWNVKTGMNVIVDNV
jgi:hypothetical protein